MASNSASKERQYRRPGLWSKVFNGTLGTALALLFWSVLAIIVSILIEWLGMVIGWWETDHSRKMLVDELQYMSEIGRNSIVNVYPKDIAELLLSLFENKVQYFGIREFSSSMLTVFSPIAYAVESIINVTYIFIVRLSIVMGMLSGFLIIFILALIDGLSERNIRTYCGGVESGWVYHHAKRLLVPSLIISCGLYLTLPITINPVFFFLPIFLLFWMVTYVTAATFKKFL